MLPNFSNLNSNQERPTGVTCTVPFLSRRVEETNWTVTYDASTRWRTFEEGLEMVPDAKFHPWAISRVYAMNMPVVQANVCELVGNRIAEELLMGVLAYMRTVLIAPHETMTEFDVLNDFLRNTQHFPHDAFYTWNAEGNYVQVPAVPLAQPRAGLDADPTNVWRVLREWVASHATRQQKQYDDDKDADDPPDEHLLTQAEFDELTRDAPCSSQLLTNTIVYLNIFFFQNNNLYGDFQDTAIKKFIKYLVSAFDYMAPILFKQSNGSRVQTFAAPYDKEPSFAFERPRHKFRPMTNNQEQYFLDEY